MAAFTRDKVGEWFHLAGHPLNWSKPNGAHPWLKLGATLLINPIFNIVLSFYWNQISNSLFDSIGVKCLSPQIEEK